MTELELQQQRAHVWHTDGNPVRILETARDFVESVGICLIYPERSLPILPTFMGAYAGSAHCVPDQKHAFSDPLAQEATDLMVRLLREHAAYEANLSGGLNLIVAASLFPFFYALVSDRNPKAPPTAKAQGIIISPLAIMLFEAIQKHGPLCKDQLRELVGRELSNAALDRALSELWTILKITRVDHSEKEGAFWDVLYRWAPQEVKEGINISAPEAISALVSKYLEAAIAASQQEIEEVFSRLTSRAKVREVLHAMQAARELSLITVGAKTLLRMAPAAEPQRSRSHG